MRRYKLLPVIIIAVGVVSGAISIYNQCRNGSTTDFVGIIALTALVFVLCCKPRNGKPRQSFKVNSPEVNTLSEFSEDGELK